MIKYTISMNNLSDKYSDNELLLTDDWFPVMASNVVEARTSLKMLKLLSFVIYILSNPPTLTIIAKQFSFPSALFGCLKETPKSILLPLPNQTIISVTGKEPFK